MYVAYCYPYTYTDLQRYLRHLEEDPKRRQRLRRRVLCQVSAGSSPWVRGHRWSEGADRRGALSGPLCEKANGGYTRT